ncbi:DNA-processing protein DprA [Demequina flava]|uniref:DNA-processing protein DprA n=1 Tax=Demequina flava TaxID=1095025 RepID=UPI000782388B|nr:DNA-processing protein DprA [Demequina flava]
MTAREAFAELHVDTSEADAWVTWSALAEPSDSVAQWLVGTVGASGALAWRREVGIHGDVSRGLPLDVDAKQRDALQRAVERWVAREGRADPAQLLHAARACGARVLTRGEPGWPQSLTDLGDAAPFALWVRGDGDVDAALATGIAVVGARAATGYGEHVAAEMGASIADAGRPVISGGAYGIDARAHRGALAADGITVAFLAGGVDRLYPAGNADLLTEVMRTGAVVSEAPPGFAPHRSRFLLRNRLISTAAATVVVEAAYRSGALSTARHATAIARPVAAVPGPVTSASSGGCHALVRDQEAVLVTKASEVLELVEPLEQALELDLNLGTRDDRVNFAHPHDRAVFDVLGRRGALVEEVVVGAGLSAGEALAALGRMELSGTVQMRGSRWVRSR